MSTNGTGLREKVQFQTNVPVLLTLDHDDGQTATGRFGDQFMYTFDSGQRIAWLDPHVRDLILSTCARKGDQIAITKRETKDGHRKAVRWEVQKVEEEPAPPPAAPKQPTAQAPQPAPLPQAPGYTPNPTTLTGALTAAINAARSAEIYAASIGLALRFTSEDVRAMAATLFIDRRRSA